jgi:uncharacterized protein
MRSKIIDKNSSTIGAGQKTFVIIFDTVDRVVAGLKAFAGEQHRAASHFTAIGAFKDAQLGYFNWEKKDYGKIDIHEQTEVLSLVGDITISEDQPNIHAHVVLGKPDGSAWGGHLIEAKVRPTLEVVLTESPAHMERRFNKDAGLALISLDQT